MTKKKSEAPEKPRETLPEPTSAGAESAARTSPQGIEPEDHAKAIAARRARLGKKE